MVAVTKNQLDCGLEVVTVEQPHLHSANVSLFVNCGSRHEANAEWGLSHLVEHMLFRGSAGFPEMQKLSRALERHGGALSASTWRDHTHLSTPIHPSRLKEALAVMADVVRQPRFVDLELERTIVEEELQQDLDEKGRDVDINNVSRASIWNGHPMGRRIAGSFESIRSFGDRELRTHHAKHYVGQNAVLCVAGRVRSDEVQALADKAFAGMARGRRVQNGEAARFNSRSVLHVHRREGTQIEVQITFEALPDQHKDFAALNLLTRVLDDGGATRLQHAICDRRGLVYELTTGLDCYADAGLYDIEMKMAPRRAASAIAATLEALSEVCEGGVSAEELELAKERTLHDVEFSIDSTEDLASRYGTAALFRKEQPKSLEAEAQELMGLAPADLSRVAREMFLSGRIHVTIMGPVERANMKRIEKLFSGFPPRR